MLLGLIGKPSSGKSTFFRAATLAAAEIGNRPFVTIKPNSAVGYVRIPCADTAFSTQCQPREGFCLHHQRFVPVQLIDVAGLIPGSHTGEGLGLTFLDNLRQADVFIHIIDISGSVNERGDPVEPLSYDALQDVTFLEHEIDMWYYSIVSRGWEKFARQVRQEHRLLHISIAKQLSGLNVTEEDVKSVLPSFPPVISEWTQEDILRLASTLRKKTKPLLIAANKIDVPGAEKHLERLRERFPEYIIIPCSAESELALREAHKKELIDYVPGDKTFSVVGQLTDAQRQALTFIQEQILQKYNSTGVQEVINIAVFDLLHYKAVFPGGVNNLTDSSGRCLPDCFLVPQKTTALDFAFKLHTDIGTHFVKAIDVKKKLPVGKEYVLRQGDVIEIKVSK